MSVFDDRVDWKECFADSLRTWSLQGKFHFQPFDTLAKHIFIVSRYLAVCYPDAVRFLDLDTLQLVVRHECRIPSSVHWIDNNRVMIRSNNEIDLFEFPSLTHVHSWPTTPNARIFVHRNFAVLLDTSDQYYLLINLTTLEVLRRIGDVHGREEGRFAFTDCEEGVKLAYFRSNSRLQIVLIPKDGSEVRVLALGVPIMSRVIVRLSFCGRFVLMGDNNREFHSFNEDGNPVCTTKTTFFESTTEGLVVRGQEAFTANYGSRARIYRVDPETGELRKIAHCKRHSSWVNDIAVGSDLMFTTSSDGLMIWRIPKEGEPYRTDPEVLRFQHYEMTGSHETRVVVDEVNARIFVLSTEAGKGVSCILMGSQQELPTIPHGVL